MLAAKTKSKTADFTKGALLPQIIKFVLPLMATNLLQTFYNAADMMVVSLSNEPNAVGAIGTTGAMIYLVLNVLVGFAVGANVIVANRLGARDEDGTSKAVHTSLLIGLLFGVIGGVAGVIVDRPALYLIGAQGNLLDLASTYTEIYFLGVPFMAVTNVAISIFRAKGDTRTPLFVLSGAGLLNVGLNLFFVLVTGMSVEGVAIATTAANAVSATILLVCLARDSGPCRFYFKKLRVDLIALRDMLKVGIPAAVQSALFAISNIMIQSSILQVNNAMVVEGETYQPIVNGNAAASNLENFVYTATNSVHLASVTFAGQNAGAKDYKRVYKVLGCCCLVTTVIALIFGFGTILLRHPLLALYGIYEAEEGTLAALAYNAAMERFYYMLTTYFLLAWMEVGSGVLRGIGRSMTSTVISLLGICVLRVAWLATVFYAYGTLGSIYLSYPVSWIVTSTFLIIFCLVIIRRMDKKENQKAET